jgi:hypothetical protein
MVRQLTPGAPEKFSISIGAGAAGIKRHFCWFATAYE